MTRTLSYNYGRFSLNDPALAQFGGPKTGDLAPDFRVTDLDGAEVALSDFRGRFVVLEAGSASCPMFAQGITPMNALAYRFPDVVFLVLYTREAHPGENLGPHRCVTDKVVAASLLRKADGEGRRILIDTLDGQAHRAYGALPNTVHVIDPHGTVVFRTVWNDPSVVEKALTVALAGGDPSQLQGQFRPASLSVFWRTLRRAGGRHAMQDVALAYPQYVYLPKLTARLGKRFQRLLRFLGLSRSYVR